MRGILSRAYAGGGGVVGIPNYPGENEDNYGDESYADGYDTQDGGVLNIMQARSDSVPVTGAIAPRVNPADAQRLSDIDRASQRIAEMQQAREASRNGGINLPLLAAAGAMLGPTKTGGFGESLSNSIGAAVPMAQRERALEEQTQMRLAQQEWNAAVKKAELDDRNQGRLLQDRRDTNTERHQRAMEELATRRAEIYANRGNASQDKFVSTGQVDDQGRLILMNGAAEIKYGPALGVKPGDRMKDDTARWKTDQINEFRYTQLDNTSQIADRRLQLQQQGMDSAEAARKARLEFDQQKAEVDKEIRTRTLELRADGMTADQARDKARTEIMQQRADTADTRVELGRDTLEQRRYIADRTAENVARGHDMTAAARAAKLDWDKGKPPSGSTNLKNILASNALVMADDHIATREKTGETLSNADKAQIRNKFLSDATYGASVYGHSLNAAQAEAFRAITAANPEIAKDPLAIGRLLYQIRGKGVLSAEKINELDNKSSQIGYSLNVLDDAEKILNNSMLTAGLAGQVGRPLESVFNVLGAKDTSRRDFESKITLVHSFAKELLGAKDMHFTDKERSNLDKIIRGLQPGDTVQNAKSSFDMIRDIYTSKLQQNRGEHMASTGRDLSFFSPQPTDRPAAAPNVAASTAAVGAAPAAVAPTPRASAPAPRPSVATIPEGARVKQGNTWFVKRNGEMVAE